MPTSDLTGTSEHDRLPDANTGSAAWGAARCRQSKIRQVRIAETGRNTWVLASEWLRLDSGSLAHRPNPG
jgi:hypothetical protein